MSQTTDRKQTLLLKNKLHHTTGNQTFFVQKLHNEILLVVVKNIPILEIFQRRWQSVHATTFEINESKHCAISQHKVVLFTSACLVAAFISLTILIWGFHYVRQLYNRTATPAKLKRAAWNVVWLVLNCIAPIFAVPRMKIERLCLTSRVAWENNFGIMLTS